ncbi:hypothetical protein KC19_3G253800 [Ceratodon purpureus]|uniref:Protein kinase domain-containing protein n=1 Tax=Ceratodon purpureus TaxID=3225 RepID=A0A8T0IQH6_CERPU|nr:hypothetical protein KC19_3G253800 [Ceratodon purpureus]
MAHAIFRWLTSWLKSVNDVPQKEADNLLNMCRRTILKSVQRLREPIFLMNKHQCVLLVKRLSEVERTLAQLQQSDGKTTPVLQELHHVLQDADRLIRSSFITTSEWLRVAIEQGDMKETFSRVLYEVRWHTDVLQSILVESFGVSGITFEPASCNGKLTMEDKLFLLTAMIEDEKDLKARLRSVKLDDPTQKELANQLLKKMNAVEDQVPSAEDLNGVASLTSSLNLLYLNPQNPIDYYCGVLLGKGSSGSVRITNLLGGEYAIKIFEHIHTHSFDQEMAALQKLGHHPHIVRLLCYSKNKTNSDCFLIMEKMDMELSEYLKRRIASDDRTRLLEAVVIMLQIAEGVNYIHSKHMAHRDLKPGNVLVTVEDRSSQPISRAHSVKIADFGLTKTRNASRTYADQTFNTGTTKYMAPEVIKAEGDPDKAVLNPRKADSYSFAIMCSEILTGEDPFGELGRRPGELKKEVKADNRPNLSEDCPQRLKSLIQRCWAGNFHSRPLFPEICQELRYIKGMLLRGDRRKLETEFVSNMVEHQAESLGEHSIGESHEGKQVSVAAPAISPRGIRQGPWGRDEPHKKTGLFDHVADSIKWMRLKYQQSPPGVGFLEVGYVSGDMEFTRAYCQNIIGTTWRTIQFAPDEYIKQVTGSVASHEVTVSDSRGKVGLICVASLTIHTNRRSYGPFGDETMGKRFRSATGKVFGFFGAGGVLLDKLGVWIIPDGQDDGDQSFLIEQ